MVEHLIKLKVDEGISPMAKKLDEFLSYQRKTGNTFLNIFFVKGKIGITII